MLSIALALIVSQNPWQWANDPKYYSGPVIDYCRNGGDCKLRNLTVTTRLDITPGAGAGAVAVQIPNFNYVFFGNSCWIYANGANFLVANSSCQTTLNGKLLVGTNFNFEGSNATQTTTPAPATFGIGLATESNSGELFHSNASTWRRVRSGSEVDNGVTYCYGWNDSTPGYQIGGAPGADTTFTAITPTETCVAGTLANAMASQTLPTKTARVRTYTTQAAINAQCNRVFSHWTTWQDSLPIISFSMGINAITAVRARIGWAKNTVFTTSSDAPADNGAWIRFSSVAGDTNYMACTGDGATTSCTSTGVAADTALHTFEIDMSESTSAITFYVDKRGRVRKTTNLPAVGSTLSWGHDVTATTATARTMSVGLQCVRR